MVTRPETAAVLREAIQSLVLMLAPFTPHMCEELWERLAGGRSIVTAAWPVADEDAAKDEEIEIPVQVNGKLRGRVTLPADAPEAEIEAAAKALPAVQPFLADSEIVKVVVANRRLVNIVVRPKKGH